MIPLASRVFSSERIPDPNQPPRAALTHTQNSTGFVPRDPPLPRPSVHKPAAVLYLSLPEPQLKHGSSACAMLGIQFLQQEGIQESHAGQLLASNRYESDPCLCTEHLQVLHSFSDVRPTTVSHALAESSSQLTYITLLWFSVPDVGRQKTTAYVFFPLMQPLSRVPLAKLKQPHMVQSFLLELTFPSLSSLGLP